MFKALQELQIGEDVGQGVLLQIKRKKGALKLSEQAFKVSQGLLSYEELTKLCEEQVKEDDHQEPLAIRTVTDNLEEIINVSYTEQGYRWRLNCLNISLGSLRAGDFGFIFARPETGKTTFLASEIGHFLLGSSRPIILFNNEEQGTKVMLRVYQAFFGVTIDVLLSNPSRYQAEFRERTKGNFKLFDSATISRREVESIVRDVQPGVVVYDQLPKIKGFSNDRDDLRLGSIFQWARELAKGSHAAIGVCQADGHAEGVRYLTMEHVANAKTAVQAEADWILGIGRSNDTGTEYVRYLNISKNKLMGDKDSISDLRHGRFEVLIKPEIARYMDVVKYD